jgi:hypothetical protein
MTAEQASNNTRGSKNIFRIRFSMNRVSGSNLGVGKLR